MMTADHHDAGRTGGTRDSVPVLLVRLRTAIRRLVRGERELFRLEAARRRSQLMAGGALLAATALAGLLALGCAVTLGVVLVAGALPTWLAALGIAVLLALVSAGLALAGMRAVGAGRAPLGTAPETPSDPARGRPAAAPAMNGGR